MATSRFFTLLRPSFLRNFPQSPPPNFTLIYPLHFLRFKRYSSSPLTLDSDASSTLTVHDPPAHPWPEWVNFVDRLHAKGYIPRNVPVPENGNDADDEGVASYTDMNLLKVACLSFARDRFDIFKSLSTQDMYTIVANGCPNTFRKTVNSAKRLRAHLELDEGDVCGSCNLRESCDRAYVMLSESEDAARTVDVVRILLLYALDPLVISGERKPPGRELLELSARKLLLELVKLGERPPDPDLPKPVSAISQRKKQSLDLPNNNESSKNIDLKPGDWVCTNCNFMNFARNVQCLKCKEKGPPRTKSTFAGEVEMKKGDWNCPKCSSMNFARNRQCFRCQGPRPERQLKPGDWECPQCDFMNFSRNTNCRKCNCDRPQGSAEPNYEQTWKKPY